MRGIRRVSTSGWRVGRGTRTSGRIRSRATCRRVGGCGCIGGRRPRMWSTCWGVGRRSCPSWVGRVSTWWRVGRRTTCWRVGRWSTCCRIGRRCSCRWVGSGSGGSWWVAGWVVLGRIWSTLWSRGISGARGRGVGGRGGGSGRIRGLGGKGGVARCWLGRVGQLAATWSRRWGGGEHKPGHCWGSAVAHC